MRLAAAMQGKIQIKSLRARFQERVLKFFPKSQF
jgi:hypothetical protein